MTYTVYNTPENRSGSPAVEPPIVPPQQASFVDRVSPKTALIAGAATGALMLCTIGFFILLFFVLL
jgi:hypothetical protein